MKDLIKVEEEKGIISKIKSFIMKIFKKKKKNINDYQNSNNKTETNIKENLKIYQDKEKIRLLELQKRFKNGEIDEYDIDNDDYEKLLKLYDEQNDKIKQDIEKYKNEIKSIIKK